MSVWSRWAVVVTAALMLFGGCWFALTVARPSLDTGVDVGIASVPLVIVLAALAGWAERAREKTARVSDEGPTVQHSPQAQAVGQIDGGVNIGPGAVFNLRANPSENTYQKSNRPVGNRKVDHPSTYIEMYGGTLSIPTPPTTAESPASGNDEPETLEISSSAKEVSRESINESEYLMLRATRVTRSGESQKIEIFDAQLADQWIKKDPWGSTNLAGSSDEK